MPQTQESAGKSDVQRSANPVSLDAVLATKESARPVAKQVLAFQPLEAAFNQLLLEDLEGRVLDFDRPSTEAAAALAAQRQRKGRAVDIRHTQIGGIVIARRAKLATRNIKYFSDLSVEVVNPWQVR